MRMDERRREAAKVAGPGRCWRSMLVCDDERVGRPAGGEFSLSTLFCVAPLLQLSLPNSVSIELQSSVFFRCRF